MSRARQRKIPLPEFLSQQLRASIRERDPDLWYGIVRIVRRIVIANEWARNDFGFLFADKSEESFSQSINHNRHYFPEYNVLPYARSIEYWIKVSGDYEDRESHALALLRGEPQEDVMPYEEVWKFIFKVQGANRDVFRLTKYTDLAYLLLIDLEAFYNSLLNYPDILVSIEDKLATMLVADNYLRTGDIPDNFTYNPKLNDRYTAWILKSSKDRSEAMRKKISKPIELDSKSNSLLLLSSFFVTSACTIFMGLAWLHSEPGSGAVHDVDFWTLLQNSTMQLLGLVATVLPLTDQKLHDQLNWPFAVTWVLAGCCFFGCVSAPIFYVFFDTIWSAMLGFLAGLSEVFLILQLAVEFSKSSAKGAKLE